MKKGKNNKKKSPSRERYEKENPVFSARIPRRIYDRIQEVKRKEHLSNTDILMLALDPIEIKVRAEEEVRQSAYDEGWEKGITEAVELYMVTYPCSVCRKEIEVTTDEEKKTIRTYMREHGWGHADCINRKY